MVDRKVTFNLADVNNKPYESGAIVARATEEYDTASYRVLTEAKRIPLTNSPLASENFPAGAVIHFTQPDGSSYFKLIPDADVNYTALVTVVPVVDPPGYLADTLIDAVISDETSDAYATLEQFVIDHPGPTGPPGPGGSDSGVAGYIASSSSATSAALSAKIAASTVAINYVRDIREFLVTGETLDRTDTVSMSAIFQRAVNALTAEYAAHTTAFGRVGYQIYVPDGFYKFDTALTWATGVGIKGESRIGTVFLPTGNQSFINPNGGTGYFHDDCQFTDFTIDGYQQTNGSYIAGIKGIFIQRMKRARFERVTIRNTWATGFGVDHLQESWFNNCLAESCGRGVIEKGIDPSTTSGASGFGIGTGVAPMESVTIINCQAYRNALYGFFTEKQQTETYYPEGFRLTGCHAEGNWEGFKDCGSTGAIVTGNHFVNNKLAGVAIDKTFLATNAGVKGLVAHNVITGNGATPGSLEGAGVLLGAAALGGYDIRDNVISGNTGPGILAPTTATLGERVVLDDNHVYGNSGGGISIRAAANRMRVTRNLTHDNVGYGIAFKGSGISSEGVVLTGNDCEDLIAIEHTMTGRYINRGNDSGTDIPSGLAVTATTSTSLTLSWSPPAKSSGVTDYTIQTQTSPGGTWTTFAHTASTATSITVTGLTNGQLYAARVAAVSAAGTSGWSPLAYGTPGVMAKYADTFTRPDSVLDGSTAPNGTSTALWTNTQASGSSTVMGVASGYAKPISGSGFSFATISGTATGRVQATLSFLQSSATQRKVGLVFRYADPLNFWMVSPDPVTSGKWRLIKVVAGTTTIVNSSTVNAATGDVVAVEFVGNAIQVYVNGATQNSTTDSALAANVGVGIRGDFADATSKWRLWKFFDLT